MKRVFDFYFSIAGLLVLFPFFILVALLVKATSKGPIFFKQERMGKNFRPFQIFKFRTMKVNKNGATITKAGDSRITPLGRWLRFTKIDELPQLINVLSGEMSFVGPRPEMRKYVELFPMAQKIILSVRPGITDPASIYGFDEERVLTASTNLEKTYIEIILPEKHSLQIDYVR